jgi:hypothetical protein
MGDAADMAMEEERYNPKTDQWLSVGDPRLPKHSGITRHYWNTTERNTMPARLTKAQIAHELEVNAGLQKELQQRRLQLREMDKTAVPAEPTVTVIRIGVWFRGSSKCYEFVFSRTPQGSWYSTGSKPETQFFSDWEALYRWLNSADVARFSGAEAMAPTGEVFDL